MRKLKRSTFNLDEKIKKLLEIESSATGQTQSDIVESYLINRYKFKDEMSKTLVEKYILGEEFHKDVQNFILNMYIGLSERDIEKRKDSFYQLILFSQKLQIISFDVIPNNTKWINKLIKGCKDLVEILKNDGVKTDLDFYKELIFTLENDVQYARLENVYSMIIDNWKLLKSQKATYETLSALTVLNEKIDDNDKNKFELIKIMQEFEWN